MPNPSIGSDSTQNYPGIAEESNDNERSGYHGETKPDDEGDFQSQNRRPSWAANLPAFSPHTYVNPDGTSFRARNTFLESGQPGFFEEALRLRDTRTELKDADPELSKEELHRRANEEVNSGRENSGFASTMDCPTAEPKVERGVGSRATSVSSNESKKRGESNTEVGVSPHDAESVSASTQLSSHPSEDDWHVVRREDSSSPTEQNFPIESAQDRSADASGTQDAGTHSTLWTSNSQPSGFFSRLLARLGSDDR